jgi:hypothetical protein
MNPLPKEAITSLKWPISEPVALVPPAPKVERSAASTPELDLLRSALMAIPNDTDPLDYDNWRNVLFGIHHATDGSGDGLALAHEFSARSDKYDPDFLDNRFWPYAGQTSGEVITERTLFALAAKHGWQDPTVADDFEALEEPQAETKDPGRFAPIPAHEFAVATKLRWIVKGILPHAELGVLYGESGSGKSFVALDLAAAIALGQDWRGHKVKQGKVVYVAAEGANGFRNRLRAYSHQHQLDLKTLPLHIIHAAPNLLDKTDALDVAKAILSIGKPDLVIVDTLAQTMPGGNENGGEDMGKALAHCKGIHRATGALVLLVHHSGKDSSKGARGWSGLRAAADVEMEVVRSDQERMLSVTKQKDGGDGAEFGFKLVQVVVDIDEDGDDVTSCIVEHCEAKAGMRARRAKKEKPLDALDMAMVRFVEEGLGLDGEGADPREVKEKTIAEMPVPEGGKRDTRPQKADNRLASLVARKVLAWANGGLLLATAE